ncbi:sigma-70 family RNA polymerase sigma factor [Parasalinivibrio latis]|uniref:RNA polymerase sigma factor n=1 Tax=Parasalinivibrio latis TaxID=2952610 RepID=UPI0030DE4B95
MEILERTFRHEYGKLVASLSRRFGSGNFDRVEDAVQGAMLKATQVWPVQGKPEKPSAWLYRVAANRLLDEFKHQRRLSFIEESQINHPSYIEDEGKLTGELQDDALFLLFQCCDERIPEKSQLVFTLKALCGFSVSEISARLFISEDNVYKRYNRAKAKLRVLYGEQDSPTDDWYSVRCPAVLHVLYLMFNEGYLSVDSTSPIRLELCSEAMRLMTWLLSHPSGKSPVACALNALMYFHHARIPARQDNVGGLVLLEEQDRSLWSREEIWQGMVWLERASAGEEFSRYHGEAGIAAEHCLAPSLDETNWANIVSLYDMLSAIQPSPFYRLNQAVAIAYWKGPNLALQKLKEAEPPGWLEGHYLWAAVCSDLYRQTGNRELASYFATQAIDQAPTEPIKTALKRRLSLSING